MSPKFSRIMICQKQCKESMRSTPTSHHPFSLYLSIYLSLCVSINLYLHLPISIHLYPSVQFFLPHLGHVHQRLEGPAPRPRSSQHRDQRAARHDIRRRRCEDVPGLAPGAVLRRGTCPGGPRSPESHGKAKPSHGCYMGCYMVSIQ
jgi:hypothetical protein